MTKTLLALVLLFSHASAHAILIHGGVLYEDGSTFEFVWDDSRENIIGNPYSLVTFTHGTFSFTRTCCGGFNFIESSTDEGDIFGDSLQDTWTFYGIDLTLDDYFFSPTHFRHSGGNGDGWRPGRNSYQSNAVRSYMSVLVPEPGSLALLLMGAIGLLVHRRAAHSKGI
jgi:hypothetical protein